MKKHLDLNLASLADGFLCHSGNCFVSNSKKSNTLPHCTDCTEAPRGEVSPTFKISAKHRSLSYAKGCKLRSRRRGISASAGAKARAGAPPAGKW